MNRRPDHERYGERQCAQPRERNGGPRDVGREDRPHGVQDGQRAIEADRHQAQHGARHRGGLGRVEDLTQSRTGERAEPAVVDEEPLGDVRQIDGHEQVRDRHVGD